MAGIETYIKWAVIAGVAGAGIFLIYKFGEGQGWWTFRPRLTRMSQHSYQRRLSPPRKTETERTLTHEAIYGKEVALPERQYRFRR